MNGEVLHDSTFQVSDRAMLAVLRRTRALQRFGALGYATHGASPAAALLPRLSAINQAPTFSSHFWELELLLLAAGSMARSTPWVLGPGFQHTPAERILDLAATVRNYRCAAIADRAAVPAAYEALLPEISQAIMATIFNWHCHVFSPVHRALAPVELQYLHAVFASYAVDQYRWSGWGSGASSTWAAHYKLSAFSYSHRVRNGARNSSRVALGVSGLDPDPGVVAAGRAVLQAHGALDCVELLDGHPEAFHYYGLGWDFEARALRAYVFNPDITRLPLHLMQCVPALVPRSQWPQHWDPLQHPAYSLTLEEIRPQSVVSYAYKRRSDGSFQKVEEKVHPPPTPMPPALVPPRPHAKGSQGTHLQKGGLCI